MITRIYNKLYNKYCRKVYIDEIKKHGFDQPDEFSEQGVDFEKYTLKQLKGCYDELQKQETIEAFDMIENED